MRPLVALRIVKTLHTAAWAFFVACILAIPYLAWQHRFAGVLVASAFMLLELAVLALNQMRCPLTAVAARYTTDRRDNFDIYIPETVARYNKQIFSTLLVAGWLFALYRWWTA
jgi:hypothetical protein